MDNEALTRGNNKTLRTIKIVYPYMTKGDEKLFAQPYRVIMDAGITEKEAVAMHQPILIRIGSSAQFQFALLIIIFE